MFAVDDLAFYNAGCQELWGARRVVVPFRRLLRRLLRPIFLRQVELFQGLIDRLDAGEKSLQEARDDLDRLAWRQDALEEQSETVQAFGWDYVAMGRRLSVLEDQIASLTGHPAAPTPDETDRQASIRFPGLDPAPDARSKVC
jgi:hypothetical protein